MRADDEMMRAEISYAERLKSTIEIESSPLPPRRTTQTRPGVVRRGRSSPPATAAPSFAAPLFRFSIARTCRRLFLVLDLLPTFLLRCQSLAEVVLPGRNKQNKISKIIRRMILNPYPMNVTSII